MGDKFKVGDRVRHYSSTREGGDQTVGTIVAIEARDGVRRAMADWGEYGRWEYPTEYLVPVHAELSTIVENGKARPPRPSDFGAAYEKAGVVPGDRVERDMVGRATVMRPDEYRRDVLDADMYVATAWDAAPGREPGHVGCAYPSKIRVISRARLEPEAVSWGVVDEGPVFYDNPCPRCTQTPCSTPDGFVCGVCGYPGLKSTVATVEEAVCEGAHDRDGYVHTGGKELRVADAYTVLQPGLDNPGTLWDQSRVWRPPLYQAKPCKCGAVGGCMCRRDG